MEKEKTVLRKQIRFYGKVQAVGFRFKAQQAARKNGVTGWVQNEDDGSVTMEIQGTERQINEVVAEIDRDPYIRIERLETKWLDTNPDEKNFRMKRGF
ncbi:MAG: acylphosphatase [Clostridia bacterium]|nr:acylphosphatase [Clostridia bacterium]